MKLNNDDIQSAIEYIKTAPETARINPADMNRFQELAETVLEDYRKQFGENGTFEVRLKKHFLSVDLKITVPGNLYDPLIGGKDRVFDNTYKLVSNLLVNRLTTAFFAYVPGKNIISIRAPRYNYREGFNSITLWAIVLGLLCGFLSRALPEPAFDFVINDLVSPLNTTLLAVLSGIIGPVLFLSLLSSITTLSSISELNTIGKTVVRRFILTTVFASFMSIILCALFFRNLGGAGITFLPNQIVALFLDMVPTNLFKPFVEGNIPQLIVLGLGMGAALLMIGERGNRIKSLLGETTVWLNTFMSLVSRLAPGITFLNVMSIAASGRLASVFGLWKYIVGFCVCIVLYTMFKLFMVSIKHSLNPLLLINKLKPLMVKKLTASSGTLTIGLQKKIAEEEFGIEQSFSEFWTPMSYAMLNPTTAISLVVASFSVAQLSGISLSLSFIIVLLILSVQLSIASPGFASSLVIVFGQLGLSSEYVGIFLACRIVTGEIASAASAIFLSLEELEAAFLENAVDEKILRVSNT